MSAIRTSIISLLSLACSVSLPAQITLIDSIPQNLLVVRSLPTAGVKLYSKSTTGLTLYNLDLSVYATIAYPSLPVGYSYFEVLYFTENTFDTDPLTIEVMMLTQDPSYVSGTRVFRDDGTIVFDDLGQSFSGVGGYDEVNAKPPLFTGENGLTYMLTTTYPTNPPTESKLYQLPGSLPCMDCASQGGMGLQQNGMATNEGSLSIFPNPASDQMTVDYTLPPGATTARLLVQDATGRLVVNLPLNNTGRMSVPLIGHASGNYTCNLVSESHVLRTQQFVLMR